MQWRRGVGQWPLLVLASPLLLIHAIYRHIIVSFFPHRKGQARQEAHMGADAQWGFLRLLRKNYKKWTTQELANRIGIARAHLSKLERGEVEEPGWRTVVKWAGELGISPELVAFIEAHPQVDDKVVGWIARQVMQGSDEDAIIEAI